MSKPDQPDLNEFSVHRPDLTWLHSGLLLASLVAEIALFVKNRFWRYKAIQMSFCFALDGCEAKRHLDSQDGPWSEPPIRVR